MIIAISWPGTFTRRNGASSPSIAFDSAVIGVVSVRRLPRRMRSKIRKTPCTVWRIELSVTVNANCHGPSDTGVRKRTAEPVGS